MATKIKTINEIKVKSGSGNVFEDLGLPESDMLLAKAQLTHQIHNIIKELKLTKKAAAELLGVTKPDLSGLTDGRFTDYPIERLFYLLNALGYDVDIVIRKPKSQRSGRLNVEAA